MTGATRGPPDRGELQSRPMQAGRRAQLEVVERLAARALVGAGGTVIAHGPAGCGRTWFCEQVARRQHPWVTTFASGPRVETTGWLETAASADSDRPHLFVVDDADELDRFALDEVRSLADAARGRHVVVVLTARRPGTLGLDPRHHEWFELGPLSPRDLSELIRETSGHVPSDVAVRRIAAISGGNPRTAVEVARVLDVSQLRSGVGIEEDLLRELGHTRSLADQMRDLPERTRAALCTAAIARSEPTWRVLEALDALELNAEDLAVAEDARWVVVDAQGITFEHPLHHVAASTIVPFARRREIIAAIAAIVARSDEVRSAWYEALATDEPDPALADRLDQLARRSTDAGDPSFAVDVWRRAARLVPEANTRYVMSAARAAQVAGRLDDTLDLAAEALAGDPTPAERAEARRIEGFVLTWRGRPEDAWARMAAEAEQLGRSRPFESSGLFLQAMIAALHAGELAAAAHLSQRAADLSDGLGPLAAAARAAAGYGRAILGDPGGLDAVRAAADLHLRAAPFVESMPTVLHLTSWVGRMLDETGESDAALAMLDWTVERSQGTGATGLEIMPRLHRAAARIRRGQLDDAADDSAAAVVLARDVGQAAHQRTAALMAGRVDALRGLPEAFDQLRDAANDSWGAARFDALIATGQAALSVAEIGDAVRALSEASSLRDRTGLAHPGYLPFDADLVEALVRSGETVEAAERAHEQASVAANWPDPLVKGLAERSLALTAPDHDEAAAHFDRSLDLLDAARSPIEWARTQLCRGERLRRGRRRAAAQAPLERSASAFRHAGARAWLALAESELRSAGAPTRSAAAAPTSGLEELTAREVDIVRCVVDGRTNREVGAALHLSPKTVENQLSRIYAKLGVRSRTELARLMRELEQR
jgi:DNA-binding CsgD family transcriptional regulator